MVLTRNQKRKYEEGEVEEENDTQAITITKTIKKKCVKPLLNPGLSEHSDYSESTYISNGSGSESDNYDNYGNYTQETNNIYKTNETKSETIGSQDTYTYDDNNSENENGNEDVYLNEIEEKTKQKDVEAFINSNMVQSIIKKSLDNLLKEIKDNNGPEEQPKTTKDPYRQFYETKEAIYSGELFNKKSVVDDKLSVLKRVFTQDTIVKYNNELNAIKEHIQTTTPSLLDILELDVDIQDKQRLLEKLSILENTECPSHDYTEILNTIKNDIENLKNKSQDEFNHLEEQLKVSAQYDESMKTKILKSKMNFTNKLVAYKKLQALESNSNSNSEENVKQRAWLTSLLSVPFGEYNGTFENLSKDSDINERKHVIQKVRQTLDEKLSYLEKPKDQILNIVSQMIRNPDANINSIGLFGVKGVGKSEITKTIADALGRPFKVICLGGSSDASHLTGHDFTYVGSQPGRLIELLMESKCMNPVVLIDELDKISETEKGKEIIGTLIHLTDSTTNHKYNSDKYFSGIEFDLSKVLFIFTYNDASKVDPILADRLYKIHIDNYNTKEKTEITTKHIVPTVLDKFKFEKDHIIFPEESIKYIVETSVNDEGMRGIKTKINVIVSRINTLLLTNESDSVINLKYKKLYSEYQTLPVTVKKEHIDIFLDESITTGHENKFDSPPFGMYI
jgi:ATP-dependent Lon protease